MQLKTHEKDEKEGKTGKEEKTEFLLCP